MIFDSNPEMIFHSGMGLKENFRMARYHSIVLCQTIFGRDGRAALESPGILHRR